MSWALLAAASSSGCSESDDTVARLVEHKGSVDKDVGRGFVAVKGKDRFRCGHSIRTGDAAWARVALTAGAGFQLQADTHIRFTCKDNPGLEVMLGEAMLESGADGTVLSLDIGTVRLGGDGRYKLGKGRLDVEVGTATVERSGGESQTLESGDSLDLEIGAAVVQRSKIDAGVEADAGVADAGAADQAATVTAKIRGRRVKSKVPDGKNFKKLGQGEHELQPGTALKLGRGSKAELIRGDQLATVNGPGEFVVGVDDSLVEAKRGRATVEAKTADTRIKVPGGSIVVRSGPGAGSKARVDVDKRKSQIRALGGKADVNGKTGAEEKIQIGERVTLAHDGSIKIYDRAPEYADLTMKAGENVTIHDPRPPTAVAVNFSGVCDGDGIVEVSTRNRFRGQVMISKGSGRANVLLPKRSHYYRVRCIQDGVLGKSASAKGRIKVLRDNGTRQLPKHASSSTVDADGRRYTLLYQNRLPAITFRWPRTSGGGSFQLHIESSKGKKQTFATAKPSHQLRSGVLGEGTYTYYFEHGNTRSKTSTLRIEFDNAAPSAYLSSPRVGALKGGSVLVAGAALTGSDVRVSGESVDLDRHGRFSTTVTVPEGAKCLAVRLAHRKHGVHYYLRRGR